MNFKEQNETATALSEPVNKLTVPLASSIGKTLQDVWELVFGGFDTFVEKKKIERQKAIDDFKASLNTKVSAIPESQLQEPKVSVIGPALEASKYYFEEKPLREMFANLVASSMDSERASSIHPSFVEIIKQMSPLDAQNLLLFKSKSQSLPIAEYRMITNPGYTVLQTNVFLANEKVQDIPAQAVSIASLVRLGLIATSFEMHLTDSSRYASFEQTPFFTSWEKRFSYDGAPKISAAQGIAFLTPLGSDFRKVCLDDKS